jgi:hypothetical protein
MMAENVKLMRDEFRDHRSKVEQDISDAFTVLRRHERIIGRIEGTLDAQDDDETRGHERNKA